MLKQPVNELVADAKCVLLAGAGGGYDIMGSIPLWHELRNAGKKVHFASLSFCELIGLEGARQCTEHPCLYEVSSEACTQGAYCPEAWLARWLEDQTSEEQSIWCFERTGAQPLHQAYRFLVDRFGIDTIILIDGGIDAILKGDESSLGTPEEDLCSLAAVRLLDVPRKILACVGLGAEIRDGISHAQVLERIAELSRFNAYLGAVALLDQTAPCQKYIDALEYVMAHQEGQRKSHVHATILQAVKGKFGELGPFIWYSPLLNLYWFFSLSIVAESHLFLSALHSSATFRELSLLIERNRHELAIRKGSAIPI